MSRLSPSPSSLSSLIGINLFSHLSRHVWGKAANPLHILPCGYCVLEDNQMVWEKAEALAVCNTACLFSERYKAAALNPSQPLWPITFSLVFLSRGAEMRKSQINHQAERDGTFPFPHFVFHKLITAHSKSLKVGLPHLSSCQIMGTLFSSICGTK